MPDNSLPDCNGMYSFGEILGTTHGPCRIGQKLCSIVSTQPVQGLIEALGRGVV